MEAGEMDIKVFAEYHKCTDVLVHEPGPELHPALLHYETNNFLAPFDSHKARKEHRNLTDALAAAGARVHKVSDIILAGCVESAGKPAKGRELENLQELAHKSLEYHLSQEMDDSCANKILQDKEKTIKSLHPYDLYHIIVGRPTCKFKISEDKIISSTKYSSQGNLYYTRDQQIVTDTGVVMGKMKNPSRQHEPEIMRFVFKKLGITPIYEVKSHGLLEGGDYLPAGDFALIGHGLRTNTEAIEELLGNKVMRFSQVVVVHDPIKIEEQMHLDTYFNIVGEKKAVILDDRFREENRPKYSLYTRNFDGSYVRDARTHDDFIEFIQREKEFSLIKLEYDRSKNFATNLLCIENNTVFGVANLKSLYEETLKGAGLNYRLHDCQALLMGYGGIHCMTQVLKREAPCTK